MKLLVCGVQMLSMECFEDICGVGGVGFWRIEGFVWVWRWYFLVIPYDLADTWCVWRAVTLGVWFKCHRFHHILKVRDLKFNYGGRKKRIKGKSAIFLRLTKGAGPFFKAKTAFVILKKKKKKKVYKFPCISLYMCIISVYSEQSCPVSPPHHFYQVSAPPIPNCQFLEFFSVENCDEKFPKILGVQILVGVKMALLGDKFGWFSVKLRYYHPLQPPKFTAEKSCFKVLFEAKSVLRHCTTGKNACNFQPKISITRWGHYRPILYMFQPPNILVCRLIHGYCQNYVYCWEFAIWWKRSFLTPRFSPPKTANFHCFYGPWFRIQPCNAARTHSKQQTHYGDSCQQFADRFEANCSHGGPKLVEMTRFWGSKILPMLWPPKSTILDRFFDGRETVRNTSCDIQEPFWVGFRHCTTGGLGSKQPDLGEICWLWGTDDFGNGPPKLMNLGQTSVSLGGFDLGKVKISPHGIVLADPPTPFRPSPTVQFLGRAG